ncbi:hypothetical protein ACFYQA_09510 [Streptomyces sp. NPDC005774]
MDTPGGFSLTLLMGLMVQWSFDRQHAPAADRLTEGLRQVIEAVGR